MAVKISNLSKIGKICFCKIADLDFNRLAHALGVSSIDLKKKRILIDEFVNALNEKGTICEVQIDPQQTIKESESKGPQLLVQFYETHCPMLVADNIFDEDWLFTLHDTTDPNIKEAYAVNREHYKSYNVLFAYATNPVVVLARHLAVIGRGPIESEIDPVTKNLMNQVLKDFGLK